MASYALVYVHKNGSCPEYSMSSLNPGHKPSGFGQWSDQCRSHCTGRNWKKKNTLFYTGRSRAGQIGQFSIIHQLGVLILFLNNHHKNLPPKQQTQWLHYTNNTSPTIFGIWGCVCAMTVGHTVIAAIYPNMAHTCPSQQVWQGGDPPPLHSTGYNVFKPGEICAAVKSQSVIGHPMTHLDTCIAT